MSIDLLTLADARKALKKATGVCDNPTLDTYIEESERRLWPKADWRLSRRRVRIRTQNRYFPLPIEVERIIHVDIEGNPSNIFNQAYEFLHCGPGDLNYREMGTAYKDLVDQGEFPTQFDIPVILTSASDSDHHLYNATTGDGWKLVAFSPESEDSIDTSKYLTIRGLDHRNDIIRTTENDVRIDGERIRINPWHEGVEGEIFGKWEDLQVSTSEFREITRVVKPETLGPVSLYAVNTTTNALFLLSKMHYNTLIPSYRRYWIANSSIETEASGTTGSSILALVKIKFRAAEAADDVLTVQNIAAIRMMTQAIQAEEDEDLVKAAQFESTAKRLLAEDLEDNQKMSGVPVIIDQLYQASGAQLNRGYNN